MAKRVAERIRMIRGLRQKSQIQAAEAIDRGQQTWSDIENGVRVINVEELEQIARFFQVPIEFFIREELRLEDANPSQREILQESPGNGEAAMKDNGERKPDRPPIKRGGIERRYKRNKTTDTEEDARKE